MVMWPMTSRDPERSRSRLGYILGLISRKQFKIAPWREWSTYRKSYRWIERSRDRWRLSFHVDKCNWKELDWHFKNWTHNSLQCIYTHPRSRLSWIFGSQVSRSLNHSWFLPRLVQKLSSNLSASSWLKYRTRRNGSKNIMSANDRLSE